jgi:hypothetical protein
MRRALSVIFLVIGGWVLIAEPMMAFMNLGPDVSTVQPLVLGICLAMAAAPLAIGVALSPGERRRELGLTILIAMAAAVFCGLAMAAVFLDPGFKPFMPPMPDIGVAPIAGTVNLVVLTAIGWWLYRRRRRKAEAGAV